MTPEDTRTILAAADALTRLTMAPAELARRGRYPARMTDADLAAARDDVHYAGDKKRPAPRGTGRVYRCLRRP